MNSHVRLPVAIQPPLIKTRFVLPPIPLRQFDWCAWYDDEGEETGHYGYGMTEGNAVADLLANWPRDEIDMPDGDYRVVEEDDEPTRDAPWWINRRD